MSQAENLLNTLELYEKSYNNNFHIVVNADRTITVPDILKSIAVQYDNNIETVTFDCPRYWDGHDFHKMNVYINYMRSDGHKGSYAVKNLCIDENDNTMIHFDWTISEEVTMKSGKLSFLVCIKNTVNDEKPHWNSRLNQDLVVENGMEVYDHIVENSPDIIEEILVRLNTFERNRTHWIELTKSTEILQNTELASVEAGKFVIDMSSYTFTIGKTYIINWNGTDYQATAMDATNIVGEPSVMLVNDGANLETSDGLIFIITHIYGNNVVEIKDPKNTTSLNISICEADKVVHKLSEEFMPESMASKKYVQEYVNEQLGVIENGYY